MNKYLEKIAAKRSFQSPDQIFNRMKPQGMRHTEWLGKGKTMDHQAKQLNRAQNASSTRVDRLNKAKSLLTKKRITVGIKTGLVSAGAYGAYSLGKSILNNLEP